MPNAFAGGSITVDDSDFINCHSEGTDGTPGGTAYVTTDGTITFTNSRIVGSSANSKGAVAYVGAGGTLRLASTMITDSGGDSNFAIHDVSGSDFAVQVKNETGGERFSAQHHIVLPHVFFHIAARFSHRRRDGEYFLDRQRFGSKRRRAHQHGYEERYSRSVCRYVELLPRRLVRRRDCRHRVQVHVQGQRGFIPHRLLAGGACAERSLCCLPTTSLNVSPSARRQSAVIKVPLPSTQKLTYIISKPYNETAELMLANVRLSVRKAVAHTML